MVHLLRIPYLGTAEEDVLLAAWSAAEGEAVHRGQVVATVETLKAAFDVEAERDGVLLRRLAAAGERVPVQAAIAALGDADERVTDAELTELTAAAQQPPAPATSVAAPAATSPPDNAPASATPPAAPAARRRAAELGIELSAVRGTGPAGLIRLQDVAQAAAARPRSATAATTIDADGRLDPAFLSLLRNDAAAFARLGSDFKVALYRRHGARIGADCRIGPGTVLLCERLVLGDGACFGPDSTFTAGELVAGRLLHFGARCQVRCTALQFGDNAFFTDDLEIGGGGAMDPEAELQVGSHGFVGEHVHLNPCRPVRIGDEVVVSRNAVVMTHSFGGSALQGYPVRFAGVTIGDGAQIGIGAVLFPGVEVGDGAIVLSGSSVVTAVPAGRLFGGVPAVDLKAAATPLGPEAFAARARELVDEFARQMELRGFCWEPSRHGAELRRTTAVDGRRHVLRWSDAGFAGDLHGHAEEVRIAPRWQPADWEALPDGVAAIDLSVPAFRGAAGPLADALREFLRKRGVRLHPRAWAYRGGWL